MDETHSQSPDSEVRKEDLVLAVSKANDVLAMGDTAAALQMLEYTTLLAQPGSNVAAASYRALAEIYEKKGLLKDAIFMLLKLLIYEEETMGQSDQQCLDLMDRIAKLFQRTRNHADEYAMYERLQLLSGKADETFLKRKVVILPAAAILESYAAQFTPYKIIQLPPGFKIEKQLEKLDESIRIHKDIEEKMRQQRLAVEHSGKQKQIKRFFIDLFVSLGKARDQEYGLTVPESGTQPTAMIAVLSVLLLALILFSGNKLIVVHNADSEKRFASNLSPQYKSVDDTKTFLIDGSNLCEYVIGPSNDRLHYKIADNSIFSYLDVALGSFFLSQNLLCAAPGGLRDSVCTTLYKPDSAEKVVAAQMQDLVSDAAQYYIKNGQMPFKEDFFKDVHMLRNPISGKTYCPTITPVWIGTGTSDAEAWIKKFLLVRQLNDAEAQPRDPPLKPGSIRCYSIVTHLKSHDVHNFFVQGYARDGKIISSSAPHSNYLLGLEDSDVVAPQPQRLVNHISVFGNPVCWLVPAASRTAYLYLHDWGAIVIMSIIADLVAMKYFTLKEGSGERRIWGRILYVCCVLLGGYFLHQIANT